MGSNIYDFSQPPVNSTESDGDDCLIYGYYSSCGRFRGSEKLFATTNPHGTDTAWLYHIFRLTKISTHLPLLLQETLQIRFERHGLNYPELKKKYNSTQDKLLALVHQVLEEENFALVFMDWRDTAKRGDISFIRTKICPLIGWEHTYFITRSTTSSPYRNMGKFKNMRWNTVFDQQSLGGVTNYSSQVGSVYRGIKHFKYYVRPLLLKDLEVALMEVIPKNMTIHNDIDDHNNNVDPYAHFQGRTKDVSTFWNPNNDNNHAFLRSIVSKVVLVTGQAHNYTTLTDIVGTFGDKGRQEVHRDYAKALLEYKIVVVCQRDRWEDHWRLFEAMISGALVFSDPMRDFPRGIEDTIVVYNSLEDLQQKIVYYLEHPEERKTLASRGRSVALSRHLEHHRWESLLLGDWSVVNDNSISILD